MINMEKETITIPKQRYEELILIEQESKEAISDIARGMKDILEGKIKEI